MSATNFIGGIAPILATIAGLYGLVWFIIEFLIF